MLAQSPPQPCPADRPIDDIIAEINKQSAKKNSRNKNPFPEVACIGGWCKDMRKTPPTVPRAPRAETQPAPNPPSASGTSSSKSSVEKCNAAMDRAFDAAHNVEVGDYFFEQKNYRAALSRYQEALEEKPDDPAIHVRLGRASEKLNDLPQAMEHYKAAEELGHSDKWTDEAHAALLRLQHANP